MKWLREHDIVMRALALLISLLLWIYVIRTQDANGSETYNNIELQIEGIQQLSDNGLTIVSGANTTVSVKVSGKRDRILQMNASKITATVNVSSITSPGTYPLNYSISAEVDGLSFSSKSPSQIKLTVDRLSSRSVPVKLQISGKLPDNYELSKWQLTPDAVSLYGPENELAAVDHVEAVFDVSEKTASGQTSLSYTMIDADGNKIENPRLSSDTPSTILNYTIVNSGSVPLAVQFTDSDDLTQDMITYTIDPSSVRVAGDETAVSVIHQISLGTISLRSVMENNLTKVELPIVLPNGVSAVKGEPATATVTIETPGYTRQAFVLPADTFPQIDGLTYTDTSLEINMFGPEETLQALKAEDFTVTTSATPQTLTEGENVIPMKITVNADKVTLFGDFQVKGVYSPPASSVNP